MHTRRRDDGLHELPLGTRDSRSRATARSSARSRASRAVAVGAATAALDARRARFARRQSALKGPYLTALSRHASRRFASSSRRPAPAPSRSTARRRGRDATVRRQTGRSRAARSSAMHASASTGLAARDGVHVRRARRRRVVGEGRSSPPRARRERARSRSSSTATTAPTTRRTPASSAPWRRSRPTSSSTPATSSRTAPTPRTGRRSSTSRSPCCATARSSLRSATTSSTTTRRARLRALLRLRRRRARARPRALRHVRASATRASSSSTGWTTGRPATSAMAASASSRKADAEPGLAWRIVVVHHGPWSARPARPQPAARRRRGVPELLAAHKVDLVFAGHDHIYERGDGGSLKYVVSGGGGAPLYAIAHDAPTTRKAEAAYHFVEVTRRRRRAAHRRPTRLDGIRPRAVRLHAAAGRGTATRRARAARGRPHAGLRGAVVAASRAVRVRRRGAMRGPARRGVLRRGWRPSPRLACACVAPTTGLIRGAARRYAAGRCALLAASPAASA